MPGKKEKGREEEFLDEFTKEIILNTKKKQENEEAMVKEEARRKRAVEIEKLKAKFAKEDVEKIQSPKITPPEKIIPIQKSEPLQIKSSEALKPAEVQKPIINPIKPIIPLKPAVPQAPPASIVKKTEEKPAISSPKPVQKTKEEINGKKEIPVTPVAIPPRMPPLAPGEIDFGKIRFLVKDPLITYIECPGENKNVMIKRAGATIKTQITLKKEEIESIIKSFSEKARIPIVEGMLTARVGSLEISSIISETGTNSFILRKIVAQVLSGEPSKLEAPMMKFPGSAPPASSEISRTAMPPVTRPFTPSGMPPASFSSQTASAKPEEKTGFMNKKIKIL